MTAPNAMVRVRGPSRIFQSGGRITTPGGPGRSIRRAFANNGKSAGSEKETMPTSITPQQSRNLSERFRAAKDSAQSWVTSQRTNAVNQWKIRASSLDTVKQKTQRWTNTEPIAKRQEEAKQILDQTRKQLGGSWEKLSSTARQQLPRAAESARRSVVDPARDVYQKLKTQQQTPPPSLSATTATTTTTRPSRKWAISSGNEKLRQSASSAGLRAAGQGLSNLAKQQVGDAGYKALRWFWWWSLAVVFVYGVATTVPVEVLRQVASSSGRRRDTDNDVATSQPQTDERKPVWSSYLPFWGSSSQKDEPKLAGSSLYPSWGPSSQKDDPKSAGSSILPSWGSSSQKDDVKPVESSIFPSWGSSSQKDEKKPAKSSFFRFGSS